MIGEVVSLQMSEPERELVQEILEERHRTFLVEISHADHHEFKAELQKKARLLEEVISQLAMHV